MARNEDKGAVSRTDKAIDRANARNRNENDPEKRLKDAVNEVDKAHRKGKK